jgi:hypothetical protein
MFCSIFLLPSSAIPDRSSGLPGVLDNSRFGAINSHLGRYKFPFAPQREFGRTLLIIRVISTEDQARIGAGSTNSHLFSRFTGIPSARQPSGAAP